MNYLLRKFGDCPRILRGKRARLTAKARSSPRPRARQEAAGVDRPILENQRSGLFVLVVLAWLVARSFLDCLVSFSEPKSSDQGLSIRHPSGVLRSNRNEQDSISVLERGDGETIHAICFS